MGTGLMGAGERLTRSTGPTGSFFTGALATLAATPCTAPYMGAAVGFALAAPAAVCILVLLTMGLGFALPMVGLSASPALVRLLPGPGPWLETVKRVLALPLYATAAWLVWVLSLQAGSNGVLAAVALMTGIGLSAWLMGRLTEAGRVARALPFGLVTLFGIAAISLLHATTPPSRVSEVTVSDTSRLSELSFAPGLIDELRSAGRPVFVNLTAAWCITCKVNETTALSSKGVRAALASYNIAYVKGDWTKPDPEISEFLRTFGRAGVPLYLLYPANLAAAPKVLPQLLTESLVLEELRAVAGREAQHQ
jgi:thiol:disulfide interchange protein DsbD